jgi:hypothetical protein
MKRSEPTQTPSDVVGKALGQEAHKALTDAPRAPGSAAERKAAVAECTPTGSLSILRDGGGSEDGVF